MPDLLHIRPFGGANLKLIEYVWPRMPAHGIQEAVAIWRLQPQIDRVPPDFPKRRSDQHLQK
jgi:hypothetical protein